MKISFKKDINKSYIVIEQVEQFSAHDYMMKMLLQNDIPGLLKTGYENINGKYNLLYDISSMQPFSKVFETKKITYDQLRLLLFSLKGVLHSLREYLLDANHLILNQDCIFTDPEGVQFAYCYDPYYSGNLITSIRKLFTGILSLADHTDERAVRLVYEIHNAVRTEYFTIDHIMEAYGRIAVELLPEEKPVYLPEENFSDSDFVGRKEPEEPESLGEPEDFWEPEESGFLSGNDEIYYPEDEDSTFIEKFRFYMKGKKPMDVLEDINNREFLSKIRQCGKVSYVSPPFNPSKALPMERKPDFEYIDLLDEDPGVILAEETHYMRSRDNRNDRDFFTEEEDISVLKGTVLLSDSADKCRRLTGMHGQRGIRFILDHFPYTVGKNGDAQDAGLMDPTISRMHARFYEEDGMYFLEDLNSTNGTFLNEQRLPAYTKKQIREGDVVRFANEEFCFR